MDTTDLNTPPEDWEIRKANESKAMAEFLPLCQKCGVDNCLSPCATVTAILSKYNLRYEG